LRRIAAIALVAACSPPGEFLCTTASECGNGGACEGDRHCSFVDTTCASGRRYGEYAGSVSSACVGGGGDAGERPDGLDTNCANDRPAQAQVVPVPNPEVSPTLITADLTCAADDSYLCGGVTGGDLYYELTSAVNQVVWVRGTTVSGTVPVLAVTPGSCPSPQGVTVCPPALCTGGTDVEASLAVRVAAGLSCLVVDLGTPLDEDVLVEVWGTGIDATRLNELDAVSGSTCGGPSQAEASCILPSMPERAYVFVPCEDHPYDVTVCSATNGYLPGLHARRLTSSSADECSDSSIGECPGMGAELTFESNDREPVFLFVDGVSITPTCGSYNLAIF